jgi:multidrug resistance efflux pump
MNLKKSFQALGLIVLLAGVGGAGWTANHLWSAHSQTTAPPGSTSQTDEEAEGVVCIGFVDLEHGIRSLAPLHPGRVTEVLVQENQQVQAGTPLLRLEDDEARFQIKEAEAALDAAEAQLEQAQKETEQQRARLAQQEAAIQVAGYRLDAARQILAHKEEQLKQEVLSSEDVITTRAEVKALEAQERAEREKLVGLKAIDPALAVRKARAERKLAQTRVEHARHELAECILKAPSAGRVERVQVGAGDIVTGQPGQTIVRFCPAEPPLIRAEIDQEFADRVRVGQVARVKDDARGGAAWGGKVLRIAGLYERRRPTTTDPSAFTDVRTVECLIVLDPGQPPLRIGQRMRVMIGAVAARPDE